MIINKDTFLQTKYSLLAIVGLIAYLAIHQVAHGAYEQTFTISAYYSPIEGQAKYVTGSLAGDIRLNGSGVNSADGTPVYPGMIAAPSTYAFGTKMNIPGIGIVAVHDRGGAIVHAGERNQSFDRLDVWMGYGDTGLSRALNWGKRNVTATVYGVDPSLKENVYLEGFTEAEKFVKNLISEQTIFKDDLWYGNSGDKVGELQDYLTDLGYYKGKIDNYYGDAVYKAVIQFQLDQNIIDRQEEFGAGYFGPRTREKIEAVIQNKRKDLLPKYNLGKDDNGDEVKKLQQALQDLGYDIDITGIYDEQTIKAVFEFQKDNDVVKDANDIGAGYFGPQTYTVLALKVDEFDIEDNFHGEILVQADYDGFELSLQLGDSGEDVKKLQEELKKFNLLRTEPTGFYGAVTENAVFKFQQIKGLVADKSSIGAGVFGPVTRKSMNDVLGYRANTKQLIASKTASFNENLDKDRRSFIAKVLNPSDNSSEKPDEEVSHALAFTTDLVYGSSGTEVENLQQSLKDLGYFDGAIVTSYFGEVTKEAVINFQKSQNIISSENDTGAGRLGPQTRDMLNSLI